MPSRNVAQITNVDVEFEWDDLPDDIKDGLRTQLIDEITATAPIEEIARKAVKREIEEQLSGQVSEADLEEAFGAYLIDNHLGAIAGHLSAENIEEDVSPEGGSEESPEIDAVHPWVDDLERNVYYPFLKWTTIGFGILGVLLATDASPLAIPLILAAALSAWGWYLYRT